MGKDENRFDGDAHRYAAYLETPEGKLRTDLTLANLQEFLPASPRTASLRVLDIGCGTGITSLRLVRLGLSVTLLDSSQAMLKLAEEAIAEAGVSDRITVKQADAAQLAEIFHPRSFDVILCHNVLEYVDDPRAVLRSAARLIRNPPALLSVVVRSQAGDVLKAALQNGDLEAAEKKLTAEWGQESLYGGKVRLFTPEKIEALLQDASFKVIARRGVRAIADYLPAQVSRSAEYERIFALERGLGERHEFFTIARYMHLLARPTPGGAGADQ